MSTKTVPFMDASQYPADRDAALALLLVTTIKVLQRALTQLERLGMTKVTVCFDIEDPRLADMLAKAFRTGGWAKVPDNRTTIVSGPSPDRPGAGRFSFTMEYTGP